MDSTLLTKTAINIVQWNSQSLMPKRQEFELLLNQEKICICIVSETWLEPSVRLRISNYNIYRNDRPDGYGGVALIIHKSIRTQVHPLKLNNAGIELVCIKILNCKYLEYIVSVYCPPTVATSQSDWDCLFSKFTHKSIVAGDFNGHHTNWSNKINARGLQILDASLDSNYIHINSGKPTRTKLVSGNLQESTPDVTFVTSDIAVYFKWWVTNETLGSDHLIVKFSLEYKDVYRFTRRRNFKHANWPLYRDTLKNNFTDVTDNENVVQVMYSNFVQNINNAADKSIPYTKSCTNPNPSFEPKPYWSPSLSEIIAQRRLALKNFRRNPIPDNLNKLNTKINEAKRAIAKARSKSWHKWCDEVSEMTSSSEMWRKMRWMKGLRGGTYQAPDDIKKELLCSLAPDFVESPTPVFNSVNTLLESEFKIQELLNCLKKKDTAPGDDCITYSMIYHLPSVYKSMLMRIYNLIYRSASIPEQWRSIKIVPIPKPNSNPSSTPKFRPISLMSCLCKIFHAMLAKRLEWFVEQRGILAPTVSGFRRSQSCLDCVVRLISKIQIGFSKNISTLACFLDIESAYNNVVIDQLVLILDKINVGTQFCKYIWSFLSKRYLRINDGGDDGNLERWTNKGLAQGDPISPLLFNIVTSQICTSFNNIDILQYADDFVLYTQGESLAVNINTMQNTIDRVVEILKQIGLEMSPMKSQFCVFSRGRKRDQITLRVDNNDMTSVDCIRYLGVWLDKSLLWNRHINETREKTMKIINLLKVLAGSNWGIHPKHLRNLYISLVRSRIDFASFLYDNAAKTHVTKLDRIQNIALRIIGGFIKTTPIHVMECELCIPPLEFRRRYLATKYCLKASSWSNNMTVRLLKELTNLCDRSYWQHKKKPLLVSAYTDVQMEYVKCSNPLNMFTLPVWVSNINTSFIKTEVDDIIHAKSHYDARVLKYNTLHMLHNKYAGCLKVYTDGSKTCDGIGAAYYNPSHDVKECFKIVSNIESIMMVELFAISEAVTYIETLGHKNAVILTDSKSALQHVARCASGIRGASIAYAILEKILKLNANDTSLRLQWIPSHVGIRGNEEVDKMARDAITTGVDVFIIPEYTETLTKYKIKIYNEWKKHFDKVSQAKGMWYRTIQHEPPRVPWFLMSKLKRKIIVMACRLRSGHIPLNQFKFLMRKADSPNCEICGSREDIQHFLMECARSESLRQKLRDLGVNYIDVGVSQSILSEPTSVMANNLFILSLEAMCSDI